MDNNKLTRPSLELRSPSADGIEEIAKNHGGKIQTEKSYPYTSGGGTSKGKCRAKDAKAIDAGITGYTQGKREKIEWYNCHVLSVLSVLITIFFHCLFSDYFFFFFLFLSASQKW